MDLGAEPARIVRPEGVGGERGAWRSGSVAGAQLAGPRQQPGAGQSQQVGGHAEQQPLGDVVQAVPPHCGVGPLRGDEVCGEADLGGQRRRPRHPGEERVGALVDGGEPGERRRADLPAEAVAGLAHRHPRPGPARRSVRTPRRGRRCRRRRRRRGARSRPDVPPPHPARPRAGECGHHRRVVVDARRAVEAQPAGRGARRGLDVEVVEDLEVVGDEADGADQHALDGPLLGRARRSPPARRARSTARASAPRSARRSTSAPSARPASAATAAASARSSSGYGSPVARIRCGSECAVNSTRGPAGIAAEPSGEVGGDEAHERRLGAPPLDRVDLDAVRRRPPCAAARVLADRRPGVVRGEDEADEARHAAGGEVGHGLLDLRRGVLEAQHHLVLPGRELVEGRGERGALGLRARRRAARCRRSPS